MITVIIPTCNRPDQLAACLDRVSPEFQTLSGDRYDVVVTDDGRREPAKSLVDDKYPWVRWTEGPAKGHAANRNHGASVASAEWLVYTDDDCLPEADWLARMAEAIEGVAPENQAIVQGATIQSDTPPSLLWEAPHDPQAQGRITANFAIRRADYLALHGIDERYRHAFEDIEFFTRAISSGYQFVSVPEAAVYHPLRRRPSAQRLAARWESRVVFALDQGASPLTVAWRLPWHVARVIPTRFRSSKRSYENIRAATLFTGEWLYVVASTPLWIARWARQPRSEFWESHVLANGKLRRYGF